MFKEIKKQIVEEVKIIASWERSDLYTWFVHAAQGDFVKDVKGPPDKLRGLETLTYKEFDTFAQTYFGLGRNYEKGK